MDAPKPGPRSSGDPGSVEEPPPLPFSALALRVFSFFLAALLGMSLGTAALALVLGRLGWAGIEADTLEALLQSGLESQPALGLWLRAGSLPLVLWIFYLFQVRFDEKSVASGGLARPRQPATETLLASLAAALILMAWLLVMLPVASSEAVEWRSGVPAAGVPAAGAPAAGDPVGAEDALGFGGLLLLAPAFLLVAFQDELIFRGYVYSTFRERFSWVHAAGLTNLAAVGLYAGHPEVGSAALLNVFLLGLALAAMRERTGSLFMGTLFSGVWNLVLGCVLSLPISGVLFPRLFDHRLEGPEGLTGGTYGPEGSWLMTVFLLALVVGAALWADRGSPQEKAATDEEPPGSE